MNKLIPFLLAAGGLWLWQSIRRTATSDALDDTQSPPQDDTGYYVLDDAAHSRARIHRGDCRYCNHGKGMSGRQSDKTEWLGPLASLPAARDAAKQLQRANTRQCRACCGNA